MGSLYQRGGTRWLLYYHNGKRIKESSKSGRKVVAKKLLEQRTGAIAEGKAPGFYFDKATFDEPAGDFLTDYRINGKKSLERAERSVKKLKKHFQGLKATAIDTARVRKYMDVRLSEEAANATINRELAALKRMLNLGMISRKIGRAPHIPSLKENNVRKGFFEHGEFLALREAMPEYLKGFVAFAYRSGWLFSEIACLEWKQVDRLQGIVTLNPGETKNDAARTLYLDDELKEVVERQSQRRRQSGQITPYVFTNQQGNGRIKNIRRAWKSACEKVGVGEKRFHDFRRTACRNMVRARIPERVAM